MEDRLILASQKGFSTAASTMRHLKAVDTFFNRWPVPLIPIGALKTCRTKEYDLMFSGDQCTDRLEEDCHFNCNLVFSGLSSQLQLDVKCH